MKFILKVLYDVDWFYFFLYRVGRWGLFFRSPKESSEINYLVIKTILFYENTEVHFLRRILFSSYLLIILG